VAGKAVELRAVTASVARVGRVRRYADRFEPLDAALDDLLHTGDRLDVVDYGRLAEGPFDRGKRRLDARPGAFALEAFDQPRFLAADIGAGAAVHVDIERIAAAKDVLAEIACLIGFGQCG
jgi:hypothetical protein